MWKDWRVPPVSSLLLGAAGAASLWWLLRSSSSSSAPQYNRTYVGYSKLGDQQHLLADASSDAENEFTVINLSHTRGASCPAHLARDLSTEIAFAFVEDPDMCEQHKDVQAVSNDHYDVDGLVSVWVLLHPERALSRKALLIDVARAGDFEHCEFHDAARICFTLDALADPEKSSLGPQVFAGSRPERTEALYSALLPMLGDILDDVASPSPNVFNALWEGEDRRYQATLQAIASTPIRFEVVPSLDLTIVRSDVNIPYLHRMALHNSQKKQYYRTLIINGQGHYQLRYRYESHIRLITDEPKPRIDLGPLMRQLNAMETASGGAGEWVVSDPERPWDAGLWMDPEGPTQESRMPMDEFCAVVKAFLTEHLRSSSPRNLRKSVSLCIPL